jgi:hypothetical protein
MICLSSSHAIVSLLRSNISQNKTVTLNTLLPNHIDELDQL